MDIKVTIQLKSPLQLSSGAADINVDTDVILDEWGLPFIPAKRFRGVLYESALELVEMKEALGETEGALSRNVLNELFNRGQQESDVNAHFEDFHIKGYEDIIKELRGLAQQYGDVVGRNQIRDAFTSVRYQTAIESDSGVAKDGSLRNLRVVDNTSFEFIGMIYIDGGKEQHEALLAAALKNLSAIGFKRNRGFGRISCTMPNQDKLIKSVLK